ncbi:MAG: hypothetical protein K6F93_07310 [Lachnospiraceae bacterium]|nr:hypothetical protein [Lachnospiraceae bacterium]
MRAEELYNNILNSYYIPNAHEEWADYRRLVTDRIIGFTEPGMSVAVIGVGESNDVDLARVYEHSGNVALFDIDVNAMKQALKRYGIEGAKGVSVNRCDLFGISKNEYIGLIGKCLDGSVMSNKKADVQGIVKHMMEIIDIAGGRDVRVASTKFDCTIAVGLHSQIVGLLAHIWEYLSIIGGITDNCVVESLVKLNNTLIPRVNEALIAITKEKLFVGYEMYDMTFGPESTIQGAVQCNHDLNSRIKNNDLRLEDSFIEVWPFSGDKKYKMLFYEMRVLNHIAF